jgi:hypothetical protein
MKHSTRKGIILPAVLYFTTTLLLFTYLLLCSFTTNRFADEFLKQLGISKTAADEKINNSILGGSLDIYGLKNVKNIALGNRKAVALELLAYTKKQVNSPAFVKEYLAMKDGYKPKEFIPQTPEEMRAEGIKAAREGVVKTEETVKKADASMKPIFVKVLEDAKKNLVFAEDPNNKHIVAYTKNYTGFVKSSKENFQRQLDDWEKKYPTNHQLYVKVRLQEFMNETKDIDFGAELVSKNGKKYFVNKAYESKGSRWKMAFRAGKEVVEPAREFVQKWIDEIK